MDMEHGLQNLILRNSAEIVLQRIPFQHSSHILSAERAAAEGCCQPVQRAAGEEVPVKGNIRQKSFLHSGMDLQTSAVPIPLIDHIVFGRAAEVPRPGVVLAPLEVADMLQFPGGQRPRRQAVSGQSGVFRYSQKAGRSMSVPRNSRMFPIRLRTDFALLERNFSGSTCSAPATMLGFASKSKVP